MIQVIRVKTKIGPDIRGEAVLKDIQTRLGLKEIKNIETTRVYRVEGVSLKEATILANKLFCESINQIYSLNKPLLNHSSQIVEIAYKPGVMNPEVESILKAAQLLGVNPIAADSSIEYGFSGKLSREKILEIVKKLNLANVTVEQIVEEEPKTLLIKGELGPTVTIPIRQMSDEELLNLSKDKLFLNLEEMKVIQKYFSKIERDPTDCELETLAQTWSEHSGHKTFKAKLTIDGKEKMPLIKRIKKEALKHKKLIVSAFADNSGVMDFYDGYAICGKGETHNSPSAIEPYGGAMTGSGGVFRDILGTGKGAKAIVSTDVFCFAPPDYPTTKLPPGTLPPSYLLKRVVAGVRDYGNQIGIPTNNGSVHFHDDFRARPTVFVGAYGIIPKNKAQLGVPKKGDLILTVGGKVGRDGIHGATFASGEMTDRTINVNSSAVQIGNAIEEKRTFDAILEARDKNLIRMIQDCGGGGLSSAIGEIGKDLGVTVNLEKTPLKYQGLSPWEIWISESQERMIVVLQKEKLNAFKKICKIFNVEVTQLGIFDGSKKLNVLHGKAKVCELDMKFLHDGLPQRKMKASHPAISREKTKLKKLKTEKDWTSAIKRVLSHGNVCSKEPIVRLYDHSVQGTNDLQPYSGVEGNGPNDAVVIRPLLSKKYGMIVSHGLNPVLNKIDPYWGSLWSSVEALSNYVAVGGNYREASLINNYVWPFPDSESLWALDKSVDAVVDTMKIFKTPVISGKDSLSSTYRGKDGLVIKIPPVLCISAFGRIPDARKTISSDFKRKDSVIVLLGKQDLKNMGGSVYFDVNGLLGKEVPKVDKAGLPKLFDTLHKAIVEGKILSCHDVSEGGLIACLFEMCLGGGVGAKITSPKETEAFLLSETAGTFLVEVENKELAKKLFKNIKFKIIGATKEDKAITVIKNSKPLFDVKIETLKKAWEQPMKELF